MFDTNAFSSPSFFRSIVCFFLFSFFVIFFFVLFTAWLIYIQRLNLARKSVAKKLRKGKCFFFFEKKKNKNRRLCMSLVTRKKLNIKLAGAGMMSCAQ